MFSHAIITGGSSGIGQACAELLVAQGSNITIIARDISKLKAVETLLITKKINTEQRILTLSADVTNQVELEKVLLQAVAEMGTPDLLITSAGIAEPGYFNQLTNQYYLNAMNSNYFGTVFAVKTIAPLMVAAGKGQIVLVSSLAGIFGVFGYAAYGATKFAVRGFAESIRPELRLKNVYVSVVYPPDTDTPQWRHENKTKPQETKVITGMIKTWSAEDVAKVMIRGIEKKQFNITPGFGNRLLVLFSSLIEPFYRRYVDFILRKKI